VEIVDAGALAAAVRARAPDAPLDRVEAAMTVGEELATGGDELIGRFVGEAREAGCSWTDIGARMGCRSRPHGSGLRSRRRRPRPG